MSTIIFGLLVGLLCLISFFTGFKIARIYADVDKEMQMHKSELKTISEINLNKSISDFFKWYLQTLGFNANESYCKNFVRHYFDKIVKK